MLEIDKVTVQFGGLRAVDQMSFRVEPGSIHSLIGPNGAGKTTLFNVVTRIIQPREGSVRFEGTELLSLRANEIVRYGIARSFQNLQLFTNCSVFENLYSGLAFRYKGGLGSVVAGRHRKFDSEARDRVLQTAELLGIKNRLSSYPGSLPYGILKRIELARALVSDPQLLLLDEPAAGLNTEETARLTDILSTIAAMGKTMLVVEHDMGLVMKISKRITVMDFGKKIAEGAPAEVANNPDVIRVYLGTEEAAS